ncbi:MAG: LamG domain-containing protein [Leptospiraceae bacterium]|nr:LamG domain-containing protein [Leptospiraceae bacterium]
MQMKQKVIICSAVLCLTLTALMADSDELILHLKFNETNGSQLFRDSSGQGHDARCGGSVRCPAMRDGHGWFRLTADNREWVEIPNQPGLVPEQEMTVSVWIFPANALWQDNRPVKIGGGKIIGKTNARFDGGFVLGTDVKDGLKYTFFPEVWDSSGQRFHFLAGSFAFQEWTHLALTWQTGGQMVGYVNGREVKRIPVSNRPIGSNQNPLRIGIAPWDTNALAFGGGIDDVRIYGRELASNEVQALFRNGREGNNPEPNTPDFPDAPQ